MYNIETDNYQCDFCGFEEKWDGTDEIHGDMFGCEKCGKHSAPNASKTNSEKVSIIE